MAPFVVNPESVRVFRDAAALERWYEKNHGKAPELWIKLHKKGSGLPSVDYAGALDAALCWGWIDGIRKSLDEKSFLQRFTPRGQRSIWSRRNQEHVERLTLVGRMQPSGQAEIDRAKADGRWARAYGGASQMVLPDDLLAAVEAVPAAKAKLATLTAQNRFALAFRLHQLKTAAARARRIAAYVDMLARGETIHPNGSRDPGAVPAPAPRPDPAQPRSRKR